MREVCNVKLKDVIKQRRSVRTFTETPPPQSCLDILVDVGRWAPTPSNIQSWRFVTVLEQANLVVVRNLAPGFPNQATAAIVVCSNERETDVFSGLNRSVLVGQEAAMAAQNMLLMAHAMGYGSCVVASFSAAAVGLALELPAHIIPVLIVALGTPSSQPVPPERKPLQDISYKEWYQEA